MASITYLNSDPLIFGSKSGK